MPGPKCEQPDSGPDTGPHGSDFDTTSFLAPTLAAQPVCSRSQIVPPDRIGTSSIASATKFGTGKTDYLLSPNLERPFGVPP